MNHLAKDSESREKYELGGGRRRTEEGKKRGKDGWEGGDVSYLRKNLAILATFGRSDGNGLGCCTVAACSWYLKYD